MTARLQRQLLGNRNGSYLTVFLLSRETRRHGINRIFQPEIITHDEGE